MSKLGTVLIKIFIFPLTDYLHLRLQTMELIINEDEKGFGPNRVPKG